MKKKYIIGIVLLLAIFSYFGYSYFNEKSNEDILEKPKGDIVLDVEKKGFNSFVQVSGTTKIKNEQQIRFNTTGKVVAVKFGVGDEVRKGETIAEIDSSEALNEIEKANLNLNNSKIKLKDFLDNLNKTGLKKANLNVESMLSQITQKEADLNFLKSKQVNDLKDKEFSLDESVNNYKILEKEVAKNISNLQLTDEDREKIVLDKKLELSKSEIELNKFRNDFNSTLNKRVNEYYSKLKNTYFDLQTNIVTYEKNIEDIDDILGVDKNKFKYYDYFSAKDSTNKTDAKNYFYEVRDRFDILEKKFENIKNQEDSKNILIALEAEKNLNESLYNAASSMVRGFEKSISTIGFTQGEISGYSGQYSGIMSSAKGSITSMQALIDDLKTVDGIEKIKADLNDELKQKENNIEKLRLDIQRVNDNQNFIVDTANYSIENEKIKLKKAKANLETQYLELEKFKKSQIDELKQSEISLERLKLDLNDLIKNKKELENLETNQEYVILKNDVKQNEVVVKDAYKKLENYMLQAPFDGIIKKIEIKEGDRLNADTQKYISIVDPDTIEIKISVNQSDIIKVKKGAVADITLGAFPDKTFTGTVSEINTTPTEQNGVSSFETKVLLNNPEKLQLYSGMKAIVKVNYDSIPEGLVVPYTAVSMNEKGENQITVIKENGDKEKRTIEVGYTDGEYYQVISGLEEGEKVLEIDYNANNFKEDEFAGGGF